MSFEARVLSENVKEYIAENRSKKSGLILTGGWTVISLFAIVETCRNFALENQRFSIVTLVLLIIWTITVLTRTQQESLMIMRSVGLQMKSSSLLSSTESFVSLSHIKEVVILEGIRGWTIIYYLAVIHSPYDGDKSAKMTVLFENTLPRLQAIQEAWQGCQDVLFS